MKARASRFHYSIFGWVLQPALVALAVCPCFAQSSNDTPAPAANPPTTPTAPTNSNSPSPKRVWTNEDFHAAKSGNSGAEKRNTNTHVAPGQVADPATVNRIRTSLTKLQDQLDEVNKKLQSYKLFLEGEPVSTGAREFNQGVNRVPVDQQIAKLEEKKKKLEAQIGDLVDEARKKGVEPGQLR